MELRIEGLDLLHQPVDQLLAGDDGQARNVVDRLFGIKFGALAAGPVQDVDQVAFEVEQAQLKHGEQADGARADNGDIRLDGLGSHVRRSLGSDFTPKLCIGWKTSFLYVKMI